LGVATPSAIGRLAIPLFPRRSCLCVGEKAWMKPQVTGDGFGTRAFVDLTDSVLFSIMHY